MAEPGPVFPAAEFRRRAAALQREMAEAGLHALLLTAPAEIFYLTGFLTRFWESPARPFFVVLPLTGAPVAVVPAIGAGLMGRTWLEDIRSWSSPAPADEGVSLLADTLCALVPERGCIGLALGAETHLRMPLADHAALVGRIAPRRIGDATGPVRRVREVKSEGEIDRIRAACRAADAAFARVPEATGGGHSLDAVVRAFQIALLEGGADWVSYVAAVAGPGGYGDVIAPGGARVLRAGDVLMLDTGAVCQGHFCDFDRNFAIGPPGDAVRRAQDALFAATERALAELRPGMAAHEAHALMADSLRGAGVTPAGGRFGHGLGLSLTEWPSLAAHDDTVLRDGMVLTLEPGADLGPGRMLVHEEVVVLRAQGPELLSTRAPAAMPELAP